MGKTIYVSEVRVLLDHIDALTEQLAAVNPPEEAHSLRVRPTSETWHNRYVQRATGEEED
jgi:hypothetical protein